MFVEVAKFGMNNKLVPLTINLDKVTSFCRGYYYLSSCNEEKKKEKKDIVYGYKGIWVQAGHTYKLFIPCTWICFNELDDSVCEETLCTVQETYKFIQQCISLVSCWWSGKNPSTYMNEAGIPTIWMSEFKEAHDWSEASEFGCL